MSRSGISRLLVGILSYQWKVLNCYYTLTVDEFLTKLPGVQVVPVEIARLSLFKVTIWMLT